MWLFPAVSWPVSAGMYNLQLISPETHPLHSSKTETNLYPDPGKLTTKSGAGQIILSAESKDGRFPTHTVHSYARYTKVYQQLCPHPHTTYTFSFSYREVRSPKVRNKFREDAHFPSVEHSGIFSEKALCPSELDSLHLLERLWFLHHLNL